MYIFFYNYFYLLLLLLFFFFGLLHFMCYWFRFHVIHTYSVNEGPFGGLKVNICTIKVADEVATMIDKLLKKFIYYFNFIISCSRRQWWEIIGQSDRIFFFFFCGDLEGNGSKSYPLTPLLNIWKVGSFFGG